MKDPKQRIIYAADGPWSEEYHNLLNLTGEIGAVKLGMSMVTQSFLTGTQIFKTVLRETDVNVMSDLNLLSIQGTPREVVVRWANIAKEEGVPAIVCSPLETSAVLEINPYFIVVNPGIRF